MRAVRMRFAAVGLVAASLASCSSTPDPPDWFVAGTTETAVMLRDANAAIDRHSFAVGEAALARHLEHVRDDTSEPELRLRLARAWLRSSRTLDAVQLLSEMRSGPELPDELKHEVERAHAAALLRWVEERACLAHHGPDSCIVPIAAGARRAEPETAHAAEVAWRALMEADPDDLGARWSWYVAAANAGVELAHDPRATELFPSSDPLAADFPPFPDVAEAAGVAALGVSGGCVVDDFDGDGRLDVMASAIYPLDGSAGQLRLFRNRGDGGFDEVTQDAGLFGIRGGLNLIQADYDNDGYLDVFVLRGAWKEEGGRWPNTLLRNLGDGTFVDATVAAGVLSFQPTQVAAWGDYDNDGWIDLFVGNETGIPALVDDGIAQAIVDLLGWFRHQVSSLTPGHLYRNNGDGTFTDVLEEAEVDIFGWIKGASFGDYDGDGRLDLFVSRFAKSNQLFRNLGPDRRGRWRFEELAEEAGVRGPKSSFSTWFWDYDNDGRLDLFVTGFPYPDFSFPSGMPMELEWSLDPELRGFLGERGTEQTGRPSLFRNVGPDADGVVHFENVAASVGLDCVMTVMGANFEDLDGDGLLDLYLGTGTPVLDYIVPNRLFIQRAGRFVDATVPARMGHLQKGHGIGMGDFDDDGDVDVYAVLGGAYTADVFPNALFENPGFGQRWTSLTLEGTGANRAAIGARITLVIEDEGGQRSSIHRTVNSGGSFGASSLRQEIGLGQAVRIVEVTIVWPDRNGTTERHPGPPLDRAYRVRQGQPAPW